MKVFLFAVLASIGQVVLGTKNSSSTQIVWRPFANGDQSVSYWVCEGAPCNVTAKFTIYNSCPGKVAMYVQTLDLDYSPGWSTESLLVSVNGQNNNTCSGLGQTCSGSTALYKMCGSYRDVTSQIGSSWPGHLNVYLQTGRDVDCGNPLGTTYNTRLGARIILKCSYSISATPPVLPRSASLTRRPTSGPTNRPTSWISTFHAHSSGATFKWNFLKEGSGPQNVSHTINVHGNCGSSYIKKYLRVEVSRPESTFFMWNAPAGTISVEFPGKKDTFTFSGIRTTHGSYVKVLDGYDISSYFLPWSTRSFPITASIDAANRYSVAKGNDFFLNVSVTTYCSPSTVTYFQHSGTTRTNGFSTTIAPTIPPQQTGYIWHAHTQTSLKGEFLGLGSGPRTETHRFTIHGDCASQFAYAKIDAAPTDFSTSTSSEYLTVQFGKNGVVYKFGRFGDSRGPMVTLMDGFPMASYLPRTTNGQTTLGVTLGISSMVDFGLPNDAEYYLNASVTFYCSARTVTWTRPYYMGTITTARPTPQFTTTTLQPTPSNIITKQWHAHAAGSYSIQFSATGPGPKIVFRGISIHGSCPHYGYAKLQARGNSAFAYRGNTLSVEFNSAKKYSFQSFGSYGYYRLVTLLDGYDISQVTGHSSYATNTLDVSVSISRGRYYSSTAKYLDATLTLYCTTSMKRLSLHNMVTSRPTRRPTVAALQWRPSVSHSFTTSVVGSGRGTFTVQKRIRVSGNCPYRYSFARVRVVPTIFYGNSDYVDVQFGVGGMTYRFQGLGAHKTTYTTVLDGINIYSLMPHYSFSTSTIQVNFEVQNSGTHSISGQPLQASLELYCTNSYVRKFVNRHGTSSSSTVTWRPSNGLPITSTFLAIGTGPKTQTRTFTISGSCPSYMRYRYAMVRVRPTDYSPNNAAEYVTVRFSPGHSYKFIGIGDTGRGYVTVLDNVDVSLYNRFSVQISISSAVGYGLHTRNPMYLNATVSLRCTRTPKSLFKFGSGGYSQSLTWSLSKGGVTYPYIHYGNGPRVINQTFDIHHTCPSHAYLRVDAIPTDFSTSDKTEYMTIQLGNNSPMKFYGFGSYGGGRKKILDGYDIASFMPCSGYWCSHRKLSIAIGISSAVNYCPGSACLNAAVTLYCSSRKSEYNVYELKTQIRQSSIFQPGLSTDYAIAQTVSTYGAGPRTAYKYFSVYGTCPTSENAYVKLSALDTDFSPYHEEEYLTAQIGSKSYKFYGFGDSGSKHVVLMDGLNLKSALPNYYSRTLTVTIGISSGVDYSRSHSSGVYLNATVEIYCSPPRSLQLYYQLGQPNTVDTQHHHHHLSPGAVVGIVFGTIAMLLIVCYSVHLCMKRSRNNRAEGEGLNRPEPVAMGDYGQLNGREQQPAFAPRQPGPAFAQNPLNAIRNGGQPHVDGDAEIGAPLLDNDAVQAAPVVADVGDDAHEPQARNHAPENEGDESDSDEAN